MRRGTLAIDLGSTTTVVAFQAPGTPEPVLLELPSISVRPGEVPSLVWQTDAEPLIGKQVLDAGLNERDDHRLHRDFKRKIGNPADEEHAKAAWAGEQLLHQIWARLPDDLSIERLVLSAPVESYRAYRRWLVQACEALPVGEIAIVDEPTAAALGADMPPGARMLVVDLGGSTLDLSLVALEGGEGKAAPVAQLLRLGGNDLGEGSGQKLRTAKVLGKAGLKIGGRDIDRWIANACCPEQPVTAALLNAAERLKCRLSGGIQSEWDPLQEEVADQQHEPLRLSRSDLNDVLEKRGFGQALEQLLETTLTGGRQNGCTLEDLQGVVAVGGGAQLPWLRSWLAEHTAPAALLTPPPVEAVALGAIRLTPGVMIQDVLRHGVSLRTWDQRSDGHQWHPLFVAGQPWPSPAPLELVLAASRPEQDELELVLGEPALEGGHEVVFIDGIPTLRTRESNEMEHVPWPGQTLLIPLNPLGRPGEDCLRLLCRIDGDAQLQIEIHDLRTDNLISVVNAGTVR